MSFPLRTTLLPRCTSCTRRLAHSAQQEWQPSHQQVRGKKKLANTPSTITVRLNVNVPTFGRQGALVPVSVGQMRNRWFPTNVAEYVPREQLASLKARNVPMERSFDFGLDELSSKDKRSTRKNGNATPLLEEVIRPAPAPVAPHVEVERITPERSIQLLSILVPHRLDFYRQPNLPTPPTPPTQEELEKQRRQQQQQRSATGAASDLLAARTASQASQTSAAGGPGPNAIFGSVSAADVATAMKAVLAANDEAARVVFGEEDVRFINVRDEAGRLGESDRVKQLGEYQVEVRIRGGEAPVKRAVRVLAQDA